MLITEFDMDEYVEVVREEYFEKGHDKGLDKGREEGHLDVARNLKSMNYDVTAISKATGLTVDEIEKIEV